MSEGSVVVQKPVVAKVSIKRQRLYLVLCSIAFSLWVVAMLVMYFTTVYPQRHPAKSSQNSTVR